MLGHELLVWDEEMRSFLSGEPSGRLLLLTLEDAFEWIVALEERVAELEQ